MATMTCKNKTCGKEITAREKKLNAGLCNDCLQAALREVAREIAR